MKFFNAFSLGLLLLTSQTSALDFSDNVYNTIKFFTNYAKVSYCSIIQDLQVGDIVNSCPELEFCQEESNEVKIVGVFKPSLSEFEISGDAYVAVDESKKEVYVVYRGSYSIGDWITDFSFGYCPYAPLLKNDKINATLFSDVTKDTDTDEIASRIKDNADEIPCEDCYVHCGVYIALSQFIDEMYEVAKPYIDQNYKLVVTGHSLGGGYSAMAGFEFLNIGHKPLTISYSGLRIGNPAYNVYVDKKYNTVENADVVANGGDLPIPSFSRVYQQTDIVPRCPPIGYTHAGLQFELNKVSLPQTKDNVRFLGASDNYKNSKFDLLVNGPLSLLIAPQHNNIFQTVYPCDA